MYTVGILERRPVLSAFLKATLPPELGRRHRICPASALPAGRADLLVVSPDLASDQRPDPALRCRVLLVPGRLSLLAEAIAPCWAVSYGASARDSLTISSFGERSIALSLQRELVTLEGVCLDSQELILPRAGHRAPCHVLACAGLQLLLGVPPEALGV